MGGGGAADAYARVLMPGQKRPPPLSYGPANTSALLRDNFHPWSPNPAAEPIPPGTTFRDRIHALWYGDDTDS
jgi:hypothetical protein